MDNHFVIIGIGSLATFLFSYLRFKSNPIKVTFMTSRELEKELYQNHKVLVFLIFLSFLLVLSFDILFKMTRSSLIGNEAYIVLLSIVAICIKIYVLSKIDLLGNLMMPLFLSIDFAFMYELRLEYLSHNLIAQIPLIFILLGLKNVVKNNN